MEPEQKDDIAQEPPKPAEEISNTAAEPTASADGAEHPEENAPDDASHSEEAKPAADNPAADEVGAGSDTEAASPQPVELPVAVVAPRPLMRRAKKPLILALCAVIIVVAALVFWFLTAKDNNTNKSSTKQSTQTSNKENVPSSVITDINFLSPPKDLGNLGLFTNLGAAFNETGEFIEPAENAVTQDDVHYYLIGETKLKKQVILATVDTNSMSGTATYAFLKEDDSHYALIARSSAPLIESTTNTLNTTSSTAFNASTVSKMLTEKVTLDTSSTIADLEFPTQVTVNGISLGTWYETGVRFGGVLPDGINSLATNANGYSTDVTSPELIYNKLGQDGSLTIYGVTVSPDTTKPYDLKMLYAAREDSIGLQYTPEFNGILSNGGRSSDKKAAAISWESGQENTPNAYVNGVGGCGYFGTYIAPTGISKDNLTRVGTSPTGAALYTLPIDSPLFKLFYADYQEMNMYDYYVLSAENQNLTPAQYQAKHGLIVMEVGADKMLVAATRDDLFPSAGCGKPVVYLYPTSPTLVDVKVGANVVVSEPTYNATSGWQNVLAQPSGQLLYQGKSYDSLFWEGYGYGAYPDITVGTVVKSSNAVHTIKQQLKAQGFTAKETADFLEYWQPKLPDSPYVRLTWLTTAQMNQLAPLTISPRPQTVIRTFLDFEGLERPISLTPQTFRTPVRAGFTATEWGGLLRGNLGQ